MSFVKSEIFVVSTNADSIFSGLKNIFKNFNCSSDISLFLAAYINKIVCAFW